MRTLAVFAVVVALGGLGITHAQSGWERRIVYFSPNIERTVTLTQGGVTLTSLIVPIGALMAVSFNAAQEPNLRDDRVEAHGSVTVRVSLSAQKRGLLSESML